MKKPKSTPSAAPRCQFHFSDGRRCRMLRSPAHSSFCVFHSRQERQLLESQRLGTEISATFHGDFLSATDINFALGKLFIAVAQGRIPLRTAAVLTVLGKTLLSSLPFVKQEYPFVYDFEQWKHVVCTAPPLSPPSPPSAPLIPNPPPNSSPAPPAPPKAANPASRDEA